METSSMTKNRVSFVFYEFMKEYYCQKWEIVRRVCRQPNQLSDMKNEERHKDKR